MKTVAAVWKNNKSIFFDTKLKINVELFEDSQIFSIRSEGEDKFTVSHLTPEEVNQLDRAIGQYRMIV